MIYSIPNQEKRFVQTNRSNVLGNLWSTKNIDLQSNLGVARLGQKLVTNSVSTDEGRTNLGTPWAFEFFDGRWWAICGGRIFKNTSEELTVAFSEDASTGVLTTHDNGSDLAVFNSRLWATTSAKLMSKATNGSGTGDWTDRTGSAGMDGFAKLAYLRKFDRLYWVEASDEIASIDTADTMALTGDYNLDLSSKSDLDGLCALAASSDRIWAGLQTTDNNSSSSGSLSGSIIEWDGISAQITKEYKLIGARVMTLEVDPETDVPYALDSNGRVLKFTGYGFSEIGRLPLGNKKLTGASVGAAGTDLFFIHPNGMAFTKNRTILFNIKNTVEDDGTTIIENLPSGVWEFDLDTGSFTHKHSYTLKARSSSTVTDFGQNRVAEVGAIAVNPFANDSPSGSPEFVCGAKYYTNASSTNFAIFVSSPDNPNSETEGQKAGYIVTPWFEAPLESFSEAWQNATIYHRKFLGSTDKIVVKYRTEEASPLEISITWVNTTSFTTTTNISAYVGYEVEGIQGTGSGGCAHITAVTVDGGTYTATVDQAFTGVTTGTAKARLQNWTKWGEISQLSTEVESTPTLKISTPRIQLKVYLLLTGDGEFHKLKLSSLVGQPI